MVNTPAHRIQTLLSHGLLAGAGGARMAALRRVLEGTEPPELPPWLPAALDALESLGADTDSAVAVVLGVSGAPLPAEEAGLADLVEGQAAERQVLALHAQSDVAGNAEGLCRLLLAMTRDLRVVPILLARRLAELRYKLDRGGAGGLKLAGAVRDIHAPLANRLGVWQLKWELEDLSFRALQPEEYRHVARLLDETRREREGDIATAVTQLDGALRAHGLRGQVNGRPKHIYSIWRKMQRKHLAFDGLFDIRALRVMVDTTADCYAALGVAHALWPPIPGEFDDYIARPKANDYRSLHTAVIGPRGKAFEIQFRTHDMHRNAELGVAAHWRYKEGGSGDAALERRIAWMRRLLELQGQAGGSQEIGAEFDSELVEDRVYVLTPRGEVIDLPAGATPLDFAYRLHTELGHRCRGARVEGRIVPLDTALVTGQRVEIMAGKEATPRRDWLLPGNRYLASARSREKVRSWFHKLDRERNEQVGREMLDRELKRFGLARMALQPALDRFQLGSIGELQVKVALGEIGPTQVVRALTDAERATQAMPEPALKPSGPGNAPMRPLSSLSVGGVDNLLSQSARCCQPVAGERVTGYVTRGHQISVHRADCPTLLRMAARAPERIIPVEWGGQESRAVHLVLDADDRPLLARDVVNVVAQAGGHLESVDVKKVRQGAQVKLAVRVRDVDQLAQLLGVLRAVPGVTDARRAR